MIRLFVLPCCLGVILEIPLLPVMGGSDVTLRCRTRDGSIDIAYFFRNRVRIGSGPKGEFTISKVKQSDDGIYFCSTDLSGHSSQSWLTVRGQGAKFTSCFLLCLKQTLQHWLNSSLYWKSFYLLSQIFLQQIVLLLLLLTTLHSLLILTFPPLLLHPLLSPLSSSLL